MFPVPPSSFPIPQNACIELHYCHNILCLSNPLTMEHTQVITYGYWEKKEGPNPSIMIIMEHLLVLKPVGAEESRGELMGAKM